MSDDDTRLDTLLDDRWHGCAFAAWVHQAAEEQGWPDSAATRARAYRYYEAALAEKNGTRADAASETPLSPPKDSSRGPRSG